MPPRLVLSNNVMRPEIRARNRPFRQGAPAEGTTPLPPRCDIILFLFLFFRRFLFFSPFVLPR